MDLNGRISTFSDIGKMILGFLNDGSSGHPGFDNALGKAIDEAGRRNAWFTKENCLLALRGLTDYLGEEKLRQWITAYDASSFEKSSKKVGLILAGNIPLVGFHDVLSVLISGNEAAVKPSSHDHVLLPFIVEAMCNHTPSLKEKVSYVDRLNDVDAVIATGNDNSARYFEYYFRKIPHVIRKNRSAVALLTGHESDDDLKALGKDVFSYFGLGCRNVSMLIIPNDFDLNRVFNAFLGFAEVVHHHKYANNYQYYRAVYALNKIALQENGFLLMREERQVHSPLSVLHFWRYERMEEITAFLEEHTAQIQCVVGGTDTPGACVAFGRSQHPQLWDYADGVDILQFLTTSL